MTRRSEAETILNRYGENVTCGGEQFRALIRPAHFTSEPGSTDFLYTGPASHKLAADSIITAEDGAGYTVRRYETVLLGGEELYVRAVLTPKSAPSGLKIDLERDGAAFARAAGCTATAVQDTALSVPWGESSPSEAEEGTVHWELTLTGVLPEKDADLTQTDSFRTVVNQEGKQTVFTGCRWETIRSMAGLQTGKPLTVKALAIGKEEPANG